MSGVMAIATSDRTPCHLILSGEIVCYGKSMVSAMPPTGMYLARKSLPNRIGTAHTLCPIRKACLMLDVSRCLSKANIET